MGGNANYKSRKSMKGGPASKAESNEGYHELYTVSILKCVDFLFVLIILQVGDTKRTAASTRKEIESQVAQAMLGISSKVEEKQTASGTKDKIAQHWIDQLIAKAREIKSKHPGRPENEIVAELSQWYDDQPGDKINPLLLFEGVHALSRVPFTVV